MAMRTTVSLDERLHAKIKALTGTRGMNQFVNDALWEKIRRIDQEKLEAEMKAGYLATRADRVKLNEDWQTTNLEGWPE